MPNTKPLVVCATLCEKLMQEKDGVYSVIRIVDNYLVDVTPPAGTPAHVKPRIDLTALVVLKSGDVVGERKIAIRMRAESGEIVFDGPKETADFGGAENGVTFQIGVQIDASRAGLYWFDVLCDDEALTSFPLRLQHGVKPDAKS